MRTRKNIISIKIQHYFFISNQPSAIMKFSLPSLHEIGTTWRKSLWTPNKLGESRTPPHINSWRDVERLSWENESEWKLQRKSRPVVYRLVGITLKFETWWRRNFNFHSLSTAIDTNAVGSSQSAGASQQKRAKSFKSRQFSFRKNRAFVCSMIISKNLEKPKWENYFAKS